MPAELVPEAVRLFFQRTDDTEAPAAGKGGNGRGQNPVRLDQKGRAGPKTRKDAGAQQQNLTDAGCLHGVDLLLHQGKYLIPGNNSCAAIRQPGGQRIAAGYRGELVRDLLSAPPVKRARLVKSGPPFKLALHIGSDIISRRLADGDHAKNGDRFQSRAYHQPTADSCPEV
ncbi:hypothetical protein D3C76_1241110 [compost metagenome]